MSEHLGYDHPIVWIKEASDGSLVEEIEFPLCTTEGSQRTISSYGTRHSLLNDKIIDKKRGVRNIYSLAYDDLVIKDTFKNIIKIINYEMDEQRGGTEKEIWLIPHSDNTGEREKVFYSGDEISFKNEKDIDESTGFVGLNLEFTAVETKSFISIQDPDEIFQFVNFLAGKNILT